MNKAIVVAAAILGLSAISVSVIGAISTRYQFVEYRLGASTFHNAAFDRWTGELYAPWRK